MLTSRKIISVKFFSQLAGISFVSTQIEKSFGYQIHPGTILFKIQFLLKHTASAQLVSVGYVVISLPSFYFLSIMQK